MSDERFNRLEELFHRCTAMGEAERTQLLESLARQDPALHAELLSLLEADRAKTRDDLLRSPLAGRATSGLDMPERIGPYRIVRELGHGGMGHVFLAEQDPPLRRQVAIKVMTTTLDAREMLARFQIERQALARMEHRVGPATAVVFVLLPGGDYFMGAAPSDPRSADPAARANEAPVHKVSVAPYFLAKFEMTQSQWHRTTGQNPARLRVGASTQAGPVQWFHPVEQVSWADASVVLARRGWRLPNESEWEYACRAGTQTPYPYASGLAAPHERFAQVRPQPIDVQSALDWTFELLQAEGFFAHRGVGQLEPNAFGLHDMGGNVAEWCEDGYGPYDREPATIDPALSVERVFRGGHFLAAPLHARSAARFHAPLSYSHVTIGVRPARSILHAGERPRAFVAQRNLTIPSHWDLATDLRGAATLGSEQR